MSSHPRVSILSGVYNGEEYLRQSVESILKQTCTEFEFIIVDDGSTDGTGAILAELADPRIVRLRNRTNLGLPSTFNRALEVSRGEFVARHDLDDISPPSRLERQLEYMERHPEVGLLGCQMRVENEYGEFLHVYELPCSHSMIAWNLFFGRSIAHPTVMIRRSVMEQVGGYDETFPFAEDFELWTRLIEVTRAANLSEALYTYRDRAASVSHTRSADQLHYYIQARQRLCTRVLEKEVPRDLIEWLHRSQIKDGSVSDDQIEQVVCLIVEIRRALEAKELIAKEDLPEVRRDMITRIAHAVSFHHPLTDTTLAGTAPGEGLPRPFELLLKAVTNPKRALSIGPRWLAKQIKSMMR